MIKIRLYCLWILILSVTISFSPKKATAWGSDGHTMVVQFAMQFLKPEVKQNVLAVLGNMSLDKAANWMDIMRSNSDYDFMKQWHYLDFSKETVYQPSTDENIVNRLSIVFNELRHKQVLCADQIRMDVLILLHLMGDLHQPLHTGYDDDLGGNRVAIQYDTVKTNLHHFWDEDIIRLNHITLADCLALYQSYGKGTVDTINGIHPVLWMKESRSLLAAVYDYSDNTISKEYVQKNGVVVKHQLLVAGLRLAAMLNKLFYSTAPIIDMKELTAKFKDGIEAKDVLQYVGKKVTVCSRVYGMKSTDKITLINLGEKYPKSPLTIAIFAKDRKNFQPSIEELYADKNICVQGVIVEYQGKAEIIVTKAEEILIQ